MTQYQIPIYQPDLSGNEKKYVNECLDTSWISSRGRFVTEFESQFAQRINVAHAASVCNGTVALHLALLALGIGPGDEVIVPTLTYIASANAIAYTGAKPVFVDSLASTWQIDPDDARRRINSRTKAVMPVHLYGSHVTWMQSWRLRPSIGSLSLKTALRRSARSTKGGMWELLETLVVLVFIH